MWRITDLPAQLQSRIAIAPNGEWIWTGSHNSNGYPVIEWHGERWYVHRLVYTLLVEPIPAGLTIDHVKARGCTTTMCVWPAHHEPVTRGENVLRGDGPSAVNARKVVCLRGHPFDTANTYVTPDGRRQCRCCALIRQQRNRGRATPRADVAA